MITEQQIKQYEQKAKDDALKAFCELLMSFKEQTEHARKINQDIKKQKGLLSEWAKKANYKVDWDKFSAKHFEKVGTCTRCGDENIGLLAYNDHGCNVCELCYDRLNDEFDEEYK